MFGVHRRVTSARCGTPTVLDTGTSTADEAYIFCLLTIDIYIQPVAGNGTCAPWVEHFRCFPYGPVMHVSFMKRTVTFYIGGSWRGPSQSTCHREARCFQILFTAVCNAHNKIQYLQFAETGVLPRLRARSKCELPDGVSLTTFRPRSAPWRPHRPTFQRR